MQLYPWWISPPLGTPSIGTKLIDPSSFEGRQAHVLDVGEAVLMQLRLNVVSSSPSRLTPIHRSRRTDGLLKRG
ncbi:MAG: hypothetical protein ACLQHS_06015, partial [Candidatus Limnocylindrales bacterium]